MSALAYLARRFVAGEDMSSAIDAVKTLNQKSVVTSLDLLGEDVTSRQEAIAAKQAYLALLDQIQTDRVRSNVSLKLTQMGLDLDENFCFSVVSEIVEKAKNHGNFVRIDMEGSAYTQRTIDIFKRLFEKYGHSVGLVLQAYLHRSIDDTKALAAIKAPIRVCKGAYKESPSIAYKNMEDIRRSYISMVEILLKAGCKVGIATHDAELVSWAKQWTKENRVPTSQFEFQFLYGLKRSLAVKLAAEGYVVRAYVPYGSHWMPYFIRRLRERKENVFFVLKGLFEN